jgi:DNA repair ATPase RecN
MKCTTRTAASEEMKNRDNNFEKQIKTLNEKVNSLNEVINRKDEELSDLRTAESELQKREQTFWELSELVNILQKELDSKHSNTLREVNFYKNRLMDYERRTPSVNKSVNTSVIEGEHCSEIDSDVVSNKSGDLEGKAFDLKDLENVMSNLKSDYKHDLDAIHASFREKLSEIENCSDNQELHWIDLMDNR